MREGSAVSAMSDEVKADGNTISQAKKNYELAIEYMELEDAIDDDFLEAAELFELAGEYKDAAELAEKCKRLAEKYKADAVIKSKKKKRNAFFKAIFALAALAVLASVVMAAPDTVRLIIANRDISSGDYGKADERLGEIDDCFVGLLGANKAEYRLGMAFLEQGEYEKARKNFAKTEGYADSEQKKNESEYALAQQYFEAKNFSGAYEIYAALLYYKDSPTLSERTLATCYSEASRLFEDGDYIAAHKYLSLDCMSNYKDSSDFAAKAMYLYAKQLLNQKEYEQAAKMFEVAGNYGDSALLINEANYLHAMELLSGGDYGGARKIFLNLKNYKDSATYAKECRYQRALEYYEEGNFEKVRELLGSLIGYKNSAQLLEQMQR